RERGMDLRQDPPRGRRLARATPRSALYPQWRPPAPGELERSLRRDGTRQSAARRCDRRRSRRGRRDFRAEGADDAARRRQYRLPAGRLGLRPGLGPCHVSVQCDHCGHRQYRCLGITIDEKGVTWGCNHCGWKGGNFYEPRPAGKKNGSGYSPVIAQYVYKQADGTPYLKVCKTENKKFLQFHWNGSAWIAGKPKGPKIPYRLPELLAAAVGTTIYFCEGEKDADALHALGLLGTTCSEGAPNGWRDELAPWFKDRHVVVLPDNDDAGRKLARKVAKALLGIAASVKIVELPNMKQGQDVSDFLERDRAGVKFI